MTRRLLPIWLIGSVLVVLLLAGVRAYVQQQADSSAQVAATKASAVRILAEKAIEKAQRDQTILDYHANLLRCHRGNIVRQAIRTNTHELADFEELVAKVRGGQAKTELTAAGRAHDLESAARYRALIRKLVYVGDINCATTYPNPFPRVQAHNKGAKP